MAGSRTVRGSIIVGIIMTIGVGMGLAAVWWMSTSRPVPGAYVDAYALPRGVIAIRTERHSKNGFVEMWTEGRLAWRGLIPAYGGVPGQPGIVIGPDAVRIRVLREGKPGNFDLALDSGDKRNADWDLTDAEAAARFPAPTGALPVGYDPATRTLTAGAARRPLAPDAMAPQPYHAAGGVIWEVTPRGLTALSVEDLSPVATVPSP